MRGWYEKAEKGFATEYAPSAPVVAGFRWPFAAIVGITAIVGIAVGTITAESHSLFVCARESARWRSSSGVDVSSPKSGPKPSESDATVDGVFTPVLMLEPPAGR